MSFVLEYGLPSDLVLDVLDSERSTVSGKEKKLAESFGEMVKAFGEAMGEIFQDPELKKKAKEFGKSAASSAEALGSRFKDEEVKKKFRDVGKAAQDFGKNMAEYFKDRKES